MKKILFLIMFLILPIDVFAKNYEIKDAKIIIDNNKWDVFYLDESFDIELLEKYDYDEDNLINHFIDNNVFLSAIDIDTEDLSFNIILSPRKINMEIVNLDLFAKSFSNAYYDGNYEMYENGYRFARFDFYDSKSDIYWLGYAILVNSTGYLFEFQKSVEITDEEMLEIKKIIDSIKFNDSYYNDVHDDNINIQPDKTKINWQDIIIASVSCGIGAVVMNLILKKFEK